MSKNIHSPQKSQAGGRMEWESEAWPRPKWIPFCTHQFGMPPTNTSELVANFPNWNSLPRDVFVCEVLSTVNVVCSSFRRTCERESNENI